MNYDDHNWVLNQLTQAQNADTDNRRKAREAHGFIDARDGQWEQGIYNSFRDAQKPRYTFDMTSSIIDQIVGHMDSRDYSIDVRPSGGDATKETAKTLDGMIRNIENISDADQTYRQAGRESATSGLDGWRVVQKYVNDDAFDQDLIIEKIPDYLDRVWFGPHTKPDASDAKMAWVLSGVTPEEYEKAYPGRAAASVSSDRTETQYYYRQDLIMVGEFLYLKPEKRELVLMSDGQVLAVDDDFTRVQDELAQAGVTEIDRRERAIHVVCSRLFDASGWIKESRKTVFQNWIPVVPCYANFRYYENKVIYYGAVEKLIDPQRVFNYGKSRQIEEGALQPREMYWLTPEQAKGHEAELSRLNVSTEPYQLYNPDPQAPGVPQKSIGAQVNAGLQVMTEDMKMILAQSAGMYAANMGDNPALQSGKAIGLLQERGDTGNTKYVTALEVALRQTGRILVNAIPRVYSPGRQVRLMNEDGSYEITTLGQQVLDQQSGQVVTINDLSVGTYDVICESGPGFKNRQSQTVEVLRELGQVDPSIIEISKDVLIGNIPAPGMDQVGRRVRRQLFTAGVIPFEDMTDQEKAEFEQMQQQPPQESPEMVLARGEEAKGQAAMADAQTKQIQVQGDIQIQLEELKIKHQELIIRQYDAETARIKAQIAAEEAGATIQSKQASAYKATAEGKGKTIDNAAKLSGMPI